MVGVPSIYFRAVFVDLEFLFIWCNQVGMCVFVCASWRYVSICLNFRSIVYCSIFFEPKDVFSDSQR